MTTEPLDAGEAMLHEPADATVGQRYVVGDCLGRGAFGSVYHAYDLVDRREVALKLLAASHGRGNEPFQLEQEFRAARSLRHPHLVEVLDFGFDAGRPFFTMELLDGPGLPGDGAQPSLWVCDVVAQLLLALEFMHARGVLHRDVKPDNLRFTARGELKLLDFGLLEPMGTGRQSHDGGTLGYVAPEALSGRTVAPASDLYAVGVIAYELLTGRRLFPEDEPSELITAVLQHLPPPVRSLVPGLGEEVGAVIDALLAKKPASRPERAGDVLRVLMPWLSSERRADVQRQAYSYLLPPGLVGRERELEVLAASLHAATSGQGCAVLVGAQAGVGKSRLVGEFRLQCQLDNVPFVVASCSCEGGGPYAAARQILKALEPCLTERHRARYGDRLAPLLPGPGPRAASPIDKTAVTVAMANLIAEVAHTAALVIWIDDMQWADSPSMDAIAYCIYEHRNAPVLWLGTYRSDEVGPIHRIRQLLQEPNVQGVALAPFRAGETEALLRTMLGSAELPGGMLRLLEETTGGNGFFIVEMMRYLVDRGLLHHVAGAWHFSSPNAAVGIPGSIELLVYRRLASLSPRAQALARFAAVLAEDPSPALLQHFSDEPGPGVLDAVNELLERNIWQACDGRYSFVHDRIREAIYEKLPTETRQALHRSIAERLATLGAPAATMAYHHVRGLELERGLHALRQAGREAEALGAMHEAFRHWKQACDLMATHPELASAQLELDLWLDLGIKCGFSVNSEVGEQVLERAIARLEALGRPFLAASCMRAMMALVNALPQGMCHAVKAALDRPAALVLPKGWRRALPPNYLALIPALLGAYTYLVICYNTNGKISQALGANARARRLMPEWGGWCEGVVMVPYAYARVLEGRFEESIRIAREAFKLLQAEPKLEAIDMSCAALVLANNQVYCGHPIAHELGAELARRATAHHMTEWQGMVQYAPMVAHALSGRTREAREAIARAQPFSRQCGRGTVLEREICLATARLHAALGELDQGFEIIEAALLLDGLVALPFFTSRLFEIRGRMQMARGDLDAAAADFAEVVAREGSYGLKFTLPEAHLGLAEVARRRGELPRAEEQLAIAEALLAEPGFGCELKQLYVQAQRGRNACSLGNWELAEASLAAAFALAVKLDNPWQQALVQVEQGLLGRERGDMQAAREAWLAALQGFEAIDNASGCARVRALLERADVPVRRPSVDLDRLAILRAFSEDVATAPSIEAVLETILVHAMSALGGQRGAILRPTPTGFEPLVGRENGVTTWGRGPAIGHSVVRRALASGEPQFMSDAHESLPPLAREGVGERDMRALVCLPLEPSPDSLVVYADSASLLVEGFDETRLSIMHSLVQFGHLALRNASLIAEAHGRSERLEMLNQTSLLVSSSLQTGKVLDHVLDRVLELTGAEIAMVVSTDGDSYTVLGSRGGQEGEGPGYSRSAVELVVTSRQPLCVCDTDASERLTAAASVVSLGVRSIMGVPLEVHDHLLGVLYASSRVSSRLFTAEDLAFLRAIASHAALAIHNARQFELVQEKRLMESELTIAKAIQQGFFPGQLPVIAGLGVAGTCRPAREVGGDYYDVVPLSAGRVAVMVGDVSGKSISAALYMAMVRTALRMSLARGVPPTACLQEVNARMHSDIQDGSFITCFLGIYDPAAGSFEYAAAGHRLGYWLAGDEVRALEANGLPLGLEPAAFDATLTGHVIRPVPGDRLVIFTDGVIEALTPEGVEFGSYGLTRLLGNSASEAPSQTLDRVLAAIERHEGGCAPWDDLTLLVARVEQPAPTALTERGT